MLVLCSDAARCRFLPGLVPEKTREIVDSMKDLLRKNGRSESSMKFIAGIFIVVDETDEKAQAKFEDLLQYADLEVRRNTACMSPHELILMYEGHRNTIWWLVWHRSVEVFG